MRHGCSRALTSSCIQQAQLPEYFLTNPASSEVWGGTGTCGLGVFLWHLALTPPHPFTLPTPHLSKIANVKRLIRAQRSQGSGLSV